MDLDISKHTSHAGPCQVDIGLLLLPQIYTRVYSIFQLGISPGVSGQTTNVDLSALAIGFDAILYTNDLDFSSFDGLKCKIPWDDMSIDMPIHIA